MKLKKEAVELKEKADRLRSELERASKSPGARTEVGKVMIRLSKTILKGCDIVIKSPNWRKK